VAATLLALACASAGPTRPTQVELQDPSGFTLSEEVSVGAGVRADFESAVRDLEQERYQSGIEKLLRVTEAAPTLTTAHIDLGIAYARADDLENALKSLERALELSPRHPVAHNELGIVLRRSGRFVEARASYERALAVYPDFHFAHRNLAILCDMYLADADCALEHYQIYAAAVPDDPEVSIWIADLRNRVGR
jgi:tetratricopeptide (TPR) repeat protein